MSSNVRISDTAHDRLRELAAAERTSMQAVLERALENYRRQRFLDAANKQYEALKADADAWAEEQSERDLWDRASSDGVE